MVGRLLLIIVYGVLILLMRDLPDKKNYMKFLEKNSLNIPLKDTIVVFLHVPNTSFSLLIIDGQTGSGKTHSMVRPPTNRDC